MKQISIPDFSSYNSLDLEQNNFKFVPQFKVQTDCISPPSGMKRIFWTFARRSEALDQADARFALISIRHC